MSVVPEDRQLEGVVLELNVAENLLLDKIGERPYARMGLLVLARILASARGLMRRFGIGAPAPTVPVATLSGGNQQKVVLARALRDATSVILAHQPTRGLDIGATREVLNALTAAAGQGSTVVLISSNLDEVLAVADRVAVMYRGRIVGTAPAEEATRELLGRWMIGLQTAA